MKKVVFTFGRINPPTIGHEKLANKVKSVGASEKADVRIYLSHSSGSRTKSGENKDPLDYATKLKFAQKAFGKAVHKSNSKTVIQILKELEKDKYTDVVMVVGSDRVAEFKGLLNKYNGKDYNFDSIKIVSAGARDPDAVGVEGMSASKLRGIAKAGDDKTFKQGLPSTLSDRDRQALYDIVNRELNEEMTEEALSIQQRLARGRVMKRNAKKIARMRKIKSKRRATTDQLKKRARKKAIQMVRKKVAGDRGANYNSLSSSEKQTIDKMVAKKKQQVDRIAKKLLNKVRKSETERLSKARSVKEDYIYEAEDKDIGHKKGSQPAKYHSGLSKSTKDKRDSQFQKGADKHHSDPSAYPEKHAGDDGVKTKLSKHTKKYRDMFGEGQAQDKAKDAIRREKEADKAKHDRLMDRARMADAQKKNRETTTESFDINESAMASLKKKADKSGISVGILKKVYDRGMAAWRTGHRPGASQEQWAMARVNSFITKGSGTWGKADKDLASKVKGAKKEEVEIEEATPMRNLKLINKIKKSGTVKTGSMSDKKEACWSGYKQVGMKKKGDKQVPNCVPEAKNAAQQAAIAIAKKEKLKESGGAGEYGTNKLRKKYSKETPMERVDPKAAMMDKAIDALHRRAQSKGDKESIGSYAFDVARSFKGISSRELEKAYREKHK